MKFLIDSDTGLDDAMGFVHAMLLPQVEIVGITSVFGNAEMIDCAYHALEIVDLMGRQIPVVPGAREPLVAGCGPAPQVHGAFGRGPLGKLDLHDRLGEGYAANFILDQIRAHGAGLTIVAMGRLTNIALAYKLDPELMRSVGAIYWMGGAIAVSGNTTPVAEANLDGDPEAARIICMSDLPLVILPLDVTMDARITADDVTAMGDVANPGVQHLTKILPYYLDFYESILGVRECAGHCGLLIAMAIDPSLILSSHRLPVAVETGGEFTRSMLVVDRRKLRSVVAHEGYETGVSVVLKADTVRYHDQFMQAMLSAGRSKQ
ncbi:nucleoside hydrolase [uncultured Agrobacterium sp.]|uniref:nucleoside hydrolase n=1 Tax=uncultured Agrobacterium sp. TaxID=157277 RepID=UPI0025FE8D6A|nr:nucleoside hydrolase [uncultured Agrobacterium sp.]